MILSHTGYNVLLYNLPECLLHKLTKVLYAAMRFIFGLGGSALHMHMHYATIFEKPLFFTICGRKSLCFFPGKITNSATRGRKRNNFETAKGKNQIQTLDGAHMNHSSSKVWGQLVT